MSTRRLLADYLRLLWRLERARASIVLVLLCAFGLLSGASLLLLLPLLEAIGFAGADASPLPARPAPSVAKLFSDLGLARSLPAAMGIFAAAVALHALLQYALTVLQARLQKGFTESLRQRVYDAVVGASWLFIARQRASDLTHVLANDVHRVGSGTHHALQLLSAVAVAAVYAALALAVSPALAALAIALGLAISPLLSRRNRIARRTGEQVTRLTRRFFADVADHLAGLELARCRAFEDRLTARFAQTTRSMEEAHVEFVRAGAAGAFIFQIAAAGTLLGVLYAGAEILAIPAPLLILLLVIFARLAPRFREIHSCYQHVLHMLPAFASVADLEARATAQRERRPEVLPEPRGFEREVTVRGAGFRYDPSSDRWALRGIDLTIAPRTTTAIVGPSGSGKSTLADIVAGLFPPEEGELLVDGEPLRGERVFSWRRAVAYVSQEPFLVHDSIRANLLWVRPDADDRELEEALRLAAADFVFDLPRGLDTVVGDRGALISGGERQRLALARALLARPALLILDEPTSHLDAANEGRVLEAVERLRGELAIIVIAHRASALRTADRIVVLDGGRIVQQGPARELASDPHGRFRALFSGRCDPRGRAGVERQLAG